MEIKAPFGFVTGCHAKDKFLVQGTIASIKYFCPDIPICLVVDGTFDVSDLTSQYDLIILRVSDLPSQKMRNLLSGNYRAKLSAMWDGPFEFFIWLDSDAIVWGDFTHLVRKDVDFHIFWRGSTQCSTSDEINMFKHYHFDPDKLNNFDPTFQWEGRTYFCSGAFACRKNAITFEEWMTIESWNLEEPNLFAWGEMGMLNYLVHSKAQQGKLNITCDDLQHIWVEHGKEELIKDCASSGWKLPKNVARPRIAHFCGFKPLLHIPSSYSKPFTIARLQHYYYKKYSIWDAYIFLLLEEMPIILEKLKRRFLNLFL